MGKVDFFSFITFLLADLDLNLKFLLLILLFFLDIDLFVLLILLSRSSGDLLMDDREDVSESSEN